MNQQISTECPQPEVLIEFLQGKLDPPELGDCESHLKDCLLCHETLVGLSSNDTLSERVAAALQNDEVQDFLNESSVETKNLLDRLTSDDFKRSSIAAGFDGQRSSTAQTAQMEIVADRAAEVLRCVTPSEDFLGTLGDYTLIRLIGAGSTGVVFQAIDETLERTVALKVLRPSLGEVSRNRFLIEAKLAASIEHVNVVTIFQVGQVDRLAFMTMPWLPGQTLESLLASGQQLDDDQIIEIICQVAAGLDAAHQKQLVHRDIKPANLWICEDDQRLKILDFGLARISDDNPNLTATGMLAGTPNFMSPEQTKGLELDGRSDLFSLGCVLYRLLAGRLPFGSPTVLATLSSIQSHNPVPPAELSSDISQDLSDLTMCLLEKQPINRPQSCEQLIELLKTPREQWSMAIPSYSSVDIANSQTNQPSATQPITASSGRGWSAWITAVIGLLLLGGFGWLLATQIIRISTPDGEVVIQTSDDDVEVEVRQDGKVVHVIDTKTQQSFSLKSGQYSFNAKARDGEAENSFTIEPKTLTMHRGDKAIVKVTVEQKEKVKVEPADSVAKAPPFQINKPFYDGKTFAQWLHALKFDRSNGATMTAISACSRTVETDEEWALLLAEIAPIKKNNKNRHVQSSVDEVLAKLDNDHLFDFVRSQVAQGKTVSLPLYWTWFGMHFTDAADRPPLPWKQINELTDSINNNLDQPDMLAFLHPFLKCATGTEAETYLTKLRKSPLGKRIKELVLTGDLQQRSTVYIIALNTFDDEEIQNIYISDLLDPRLNESSVTLGSITKPWPFIRRHLFDEIYGAIDPEYWCFGRKVDAAAEAKFAWKAADLLAKVTDGVLEKGLLFSDTASADASGQNNFNFLATINQKFYGLAQRTNDENLKQRMLKKLEAIRGSLASPTLAPMVSNEFHDVLVADLDYVIAYCKGDAPSELPLGTQLWQQEPDETSAAEVEPVAAVAKTPITLPANADKPIYDGRTFALWLQAAKFDRAAGAKVTAALGCARTAESDEEWAQFLDVSATLLVKKTPTSKEHEAVRQVLLAINAKHLFSFLKSEISQGESASEPFFGRWFRANFPSENSPPLPWEQINELTNVIGQNSSRHDVFEFLQPILDKLYYKRGPEAVAYLTRVRKSLAGKRIKELALEGSLQEKIDVFHLALRIFDDQEVRESYKNVVLDPSLNDRSVMENSISKPWPALKPMVIGNLLRAMDPKKWDFSDDKDDDVRAEAAYVSEAADLLVKVTDGFVKKELFADPVSEKAFRSPGSLDFLNVVFFDVVQRTNDKNLKQRLLKSFEAFRATLAPEVTDNDDEMKDRVRDLDYVIAFCKAFPPARLPPNSRLHVRKPREKPAGKVEKVAPTAETSKTAKAINKATFAGRTFVQWLDAAKLGRADRTTAYRADRATADATADAILGCLKTVKTDEEWAQLLDFTTSYSFNTVGSDISREIRRAVEEVIQAVSADRLFDFVESEIEQGKSTSLPSFSVWFRKRFQSKDPPPLPWKQINELTDLINQNADKPGGLEFLTQILLSMRSIDGPEAKAYVTKLRNSPAGQRVREIASTGNLQRRFDVSKIALGIFDDEAIREIYQRDLFDLKLDDKRVYSSSGARPWNLYSSSKPLPWKFLRGDLLKKLFAAMDPEYWTWDNNQLDATEEAKYVTEASDLLAKVADEFATKRLPSLFLEDVLERFFDVAQRTSYGGIKQRMLQKLEIIKESLDPERVPKYRVKDLDYIIAFYKGNPPAELPPRTSLRVREKAKEPAKKVEQVKPDAEKPNAKPATQISKPFFKGKTFAQWLHAAQFDRADGATANAILGCVKTVETDAEWAQLLEVVISFKIERVKGRENVNSRQAYDAVIEAVSADHLFDFVEVEIVQGKFESLPFFSNWFWKHYREPDPPPRPWKQINKLIGLINENFDKLDAVESPELPFSLPTKPVPRLLTPIFSSMRSIDGLEAQTSVTNLRNSPAGKRIRELALTGDMLQRFEVYEVALGVFDEVAIRDIYKRDLLDPKLEKGSLIPDSAPWLLSSYRSDLLPKIFTTMDPEYWASDKKVVSAAAEAKYVTEASDLLVKIADDFLERRSLFSKGSNGRPHIPDGVFWSSMILGRFFDVAQRTNDESIKQRLLEKLEAIRLANKDGRAELDYVIAYCKGKPLAKLPHRTYLRLRKTTTATAKPIGEGKPQQNDQQFLLTTDAPNEKPSFRNGASTLLEINIAAVTENGELNKKSPTWAKLKTAVEDRSKILQVKGPNNLLHARFFISKKDRQSFKYVAAIKAHVNKVLADTDVYVVCVDITSYNSEMTWKKFVNQK